MRVRILFGAAVAAAGAAIAVAQPTQPATPPPGISQPIAPPSNSGYYSYGGSGGGYHASTAAEGAATGMSNVVRAQGEASLNRSAAAINYTVAQSNEIQNRAAYTSTYFQMRQENRQARAAERRPRATMEELVRYAQAGKPKPLSPGEMDKVTGTVRWPLALQVDGFAKQRAELEKIVAGRASTGTLSPADYMKVRQLTSTMLDDLKSKIRDIPPEQYTLAKRFLESLAYEATRPLG
jgi:hypothetical protein